MKLPTDIVTRNKIRDSKICSLYAMDSATMEEIGSRFRISTSRVQQIIYRNRHLLEIDKKYEEIKQINRIKGHIKKTSESKKDVYDWETLLDSKITPKKVEHSGKIEGEGTKIYIVRPEKKESKDAEGIQVDNPAGRSIRVSD